MFSNKSNSFFLLLSVILFSESVNILLIWNKAVPRYISIVFVSLIFLFLYYLTNQYTNRHNRKYHEILNFKKVGISFFFIGLLLIYFNFNNQLPFRSTLLISLGLILINYEYLISKFNLDIINFALFFNLFLAFCFSFVEISINFFNLIGSNLLNFLPDDNLIVYYFLGKPLSTLLNLLGIIAISEGESLWYSNLDSSRMEKLIIAKSCSGLYSIIILLSATLSYLITLSRARFEIKVNIFILSILIAYISNLVRMTLVVISGHLYGSQVLILIHEYAGSFIFLTVNAIFWAILFNMESYWTNVNE